MLVWFVTGHSLNLVCFAEKLGVVVSWVLHGPLHRTTVENAENLEGTERCD